MWRLERDRGGERSVWFQCCVGAFGRGGKLKVFKKYNGVVGNNGAGKGVNLGREKYIQQ